MSPRAAWRLASIGFTEVYDYVAGKADWMGCGLPIEGTKAGVPRAQDAARKDVPTCALHEPVVDVRQRVAEAGWDTCIVVNDQRVVLGRLGKKALASDPARKVEDVMRSGPSTIRPDTELEAQLKEMDEKGTDAALVTTSRGRLVGVLYRTDITRVLGSS
jgi:predicted transcriptional regulator